MIRPWQLPSRLSPWLGRAQRLTSWHVQTVHSVKAEAASLRQCSDGQLRQAADGLRDSVQAGSSILSQPILVGVFALVYEAVRRMLGTELYDGQLAASAVLAQGAIAEMQTGEGKTLAAAAPAALHALTGKGVHVITVNAYLAHRDMTLLRPVYEMLGLSAGLIEAGANPRGKRQAYGCDITYGPGYEFGFDYLRDQVGLHRQLRPALGHTYRAALRGQDAPSAASLQRHLGLAIIDEVDSVLIDEARLPLILSNSPAVGPVQQGTSVYHQAHHLAAQLVAGQDFMLDGVAGEVQLTERGYAAAERVWNELGRPAVQRPWPIYVENAAAGRPAPEQGCRLPDRRRPGADCGRVHGADPRGPLVAGGPTPGGRGQGGPGVDG